MYYKEEDIVIRTGIKEDVETISKIASKYSKEIGFVMKVVLEESCETKTLYTVLYKNEIVGFCNFNIRNKDKVCIIYEICIDEKCRGLGLAKKTIDLLPKPIQLKCPIDNKSNKFYEGIGFTKIGIEKGKKRPLNIWRKSK